MAIDSIERFLQLIQKNQLEEISLEESIELRRLSAEFADKCGEQVEQKMNDFYRF